MNPSKALTNSPQTHHFSLPSKPISASNLNNNTTNFPSLFYEPTSVLDPHLTSSPAAAAGPLHFPAATAPPPFDDWDPVSWFLSSENNDFAPPLKSQFHYLEEEESTPFDLPDLDYLPSSDPPSIPTPTPPTTFDRTHLDLLIKAAHSVESNDIPRAHVILARLNHLFPSSSPGVLPLQRAAFHFKDALLSLLPIPNPPTPSPPLSPLETIHRITAHKSLSDLSPVPQFTSFTANQILLESLLDSSSSSLAQSQSLHLIDFDICLGGQWSSFAQEIAARSRSTRSPPPQIRITAVVPEETVETALAAENLCDFARGIGIRLSLDFVSVGSLGTLALAGVRLNGGDSVAVVLTPTIFRLLGFATESSTALLRFVRSVSPRIVVFVDSECFSNSESFKRSFARGLEFYGAVLESLDSAAAATGAEYEQVRRIERSVIRPRIFSSVAGWGPQVMTWWEMFASAGMEPVPFSEFTASQAEWLLRRSTVDGFHVARTEGSMMLSWRGMELVSTSAWKC